MERLALDATAGDALRLIADSYDTLSFASVNLAVRCSITAIDLCAAALGRACQSWPTSKGREADLGDVIAKPRRFVSDDAAVQRAISVLTAVVTDTRWTDLGDLRDRLTHRHVPRGVVGRAAIVLDGFGTGSSAPTTSVPAGRQR